MEDYAVLDDKLQRKLLMSLKEGKLSHAEYVKTSRALGALLHNLFLMDNDLIREELEKGFNKEVL